MMKRTPVRLGAEDPSPMSSQSSAQIQQQGSSNMHTLAQTAQPQLLSTAMLSVGSGYRGGSRPGTPAVLNYMKASNVQYAPKQSSPQVPRHKLPPQQSPLPQLPGALERQSPGAQLPAAAPAGAQFQRLKVEDALSYLDQVKYKFNTQPQVYNDFLDIMKEFKSQTIDTPGVITRVSNLFKGHPELIVGFNTFLPPGYKIEVQSNGQVSVSMPSPTGLGAGGVLLGATLHHAPPQPQLVHLLPVAQSVSSGSIVHNLSVNASPSNNLHHISQAHQQIEAAIHHQPGGVQPGPGGGAGGAGGPHAAAAAGQPVEFNHAIEYVNKIKSRFSRQPDKYKRFLEILHAYQRGHRDLKEPHAKQQTEQEVYAQVAKLFENQDDLLAEFGQFLPDAKAVTKPPPVHYAPRQDHTPPPPPPHAQQSDSERYGAASPAPHQQPTHLHQVVSKHAASVSAPPAGPPGAQPAPPPSPLPAPAPPAAASPAPPAAQPQHAHPHPHPHAHPHASLKRSPPYTSTVQLGLATGVSPAKRARATSGASAMTAAAAAAAVNALAGGAGNAGVGAGAVGSPGAVGAVGAAAGRDVSLAEATKHATVHEYSFFDRVKKALRTEHVYDNFLRVLMLYTNEVITASELLVQTAQFFRRHPELQRWLADFLCAAEQPPPPSAAHHQLDVAHAPHAPHAPPARHNISFNNGAYPACGSNASLLGYAALGAGGAAAPTAVGVGVGVVGGAAVRKPSKYEPLGALGAQLRHERPQGDAAMDIDLTTCRRLGTSYCELPREAASVKCSGRTPLCNEVLNDKWVSFPSWSEDSTFVTSRKTQYEEYIYRCEDERFELDVVIDSNASTLHVLESVQKKLNRMTGEDAAKFRLDDCLGGFSPTIGQRAIRRIYGDKVAVDVIAGLKKNPAVAVPVVLRRLRAKDEEWREAQKGFNKQWREQNEKYYLKSLDHQGITFKQNDLKALRSKALLNDVESAYADCRQGPHLAVDYNMHSRQEAIKIVRDAAELLIHHARRQTAIQKAEKRRIKQLLRHFLPDLFAHPRQQLSDDERDEEDKEATASPGSADGDQPPADADCNDKNESSESDNASDKSGRNNNNKNDKENKPKNNNNTDSKESASNSSSKRGSNGADDCLKGDELADECRDQPPNEARFVCTVPWYLFLRLHCTLCARLAGARRAALALPPDSAHLRRAAAAVQLRLKSDVLPQGASCPAEYYDALLELVKNVLDGNTEPAAYEDAAREMLGIKAYPTYTLDKLVSNAVRQLQHCVTDAESVSAAEMCSRQMRGPAHYVRRALRSLRTDHTVYLARVYGGEECRMTFELLSPGAGGASPAGSGRLSPARAPAPAPAAPGPAPGPPGGGALSGPGAGAGGASNAAEAAARLAAWSLYKEKYVRTEPPAGVTQVSRHKPVFLRRNARAGGGGGAGSGGDSEGGDNAARAPPGRAAPPPPPGHARRKPARLHLHLHDHTECTLNNTIRLVASRPHWMYRPGCLTAAAASHPRLHAARRERFHAWLRLRTAPPAAPAPPAPPAPPPVAPAACT